MGIVIHHTYPVIHRIRHQCPKLRFRLIPMGAQGNQEQNLLIRDANHIVKIIQQQGANPFLMHPRTGLVANDNGHLIFLCQHILQCRGRNSVFLHSLAEDLRQILHRGRSRCLQHLNFPGFHRYRNVSIAISKNKFLLHHLSCLSYTRRLIMPALMLHRTIPVTGLISIVPIFRVFCIQPGSFLPIFHVFASLIAPSS